MNSSTRFLGALQKRVDKIIQRVDNAAEHTPDEWVFIRKDEGILTQLAMELIVDEAEEDTIPKYEVVIFAEHWQIREI